MLPSIDSPDVAAAPGRVALNLAVAKSRLGQRVRSSRLVRVGRIHHQTSCTRSTANVHTIPPQIPHARKQSLRVMLVGTRVSSGGGSARGGRKRIPVTCKSRETLEID